jgi:phytoene synthase
MSTEWDFPNTATPVGSPNYYIIRFSPAEQRHSLAHWFAWFAHINGIANKAKDPGVARLKLDWWREEIHYMQQQQARHPLAQALSIQVQDDWQITQMRDLLDATEQRIRKLTPNDEIQFHQACEQYGGSRAILLSNTSNEAIQQQAKQLGCYCAAVQHIQTLGRDLQQGYSSLPKHYQDGLPDKLADLLKQLEKPIRQDWSQLRQEKYLQVTLRMTAQALQLSRLMQTKGFNCREYYLQLSPLRNLWHAWRMQ